MILLSACRRIIASAGIVVLLLAAAMPATIVRAETANQRADLFAAAASEFGVPQEVLMAVSYNQSRWENHKGKPSASGGYGLMHLTSAEVEAKDGRGDPTRPRASRQKSNHLTLDEAANLLQAAPDELKQSDQQNIRGGAALLARYAKELNGGQLPQHVGDWYGAVARLSDAPDKESAGDFADNVFATMNGGASHATTDGQQLALPKRHAEPNRAALDQLGLPPAPEYKRALRSQAECPPNLTCKFVPARFAQNNPSDPTDYGNYDEANRPSGMKIKYIVIHDTEGSYQSAIDWYQDPRSYVAAHYTIRSSDGEVTQSVKNDDVAWHAGNWYVNMHSIGIEHEGFAAEGATWYTEAMYRSSAKLVRYLAQKYNIPLDREHILGHDQYHAPTPNRVAGMHWDPGPYWDWDHYMDLLYAADEPSAWNGNSALISPEFQENKPPVEDCEGGPCSPLPSQPANFVYVRTEPRADAPLVTDAGLHPDGAPGTIAAHDWSAKATTGQHFALAGRQGDWTAIWFNGQRGWFYNPDRPREKTARNVRTRLVTPKAGVSSIPVYGRPLPEAAAYATTGAPVQAIQPLQYVIPAGQAYPAYDHEAVNDYFHVLAFDRSTPGDGTLTIGTDKYIPIEFNHRQAYVKASDVDRLE